MSSDSHWLEDRKTCKHDGTRSVTPALDLMERATLPLATKALATEPPSSGEGSNIVVGAVGFLRLVCAAAHRLRDVNHIRESFIWTPVQPEAQGSYYVGRMMSDDGK